MTSRLIGLRKLAGLNQKELASLLGVTAVTVSKWEQGRLAIAPENLEKLTEIFKCSKGYLLGEE